MKQSNQQRLAANHPSPPPSAVMIAFPQSRRVHLVEKTASRVAHAKSQERGEKLLAAAVSKQRAAMMRKGIPAHKVERECRALENAVRARLFRLILIPSAGNDTA
jgi:hypothetical protein